MLQLRKNSLSRTASHNTKHEKKYFQRERNYNGKVSSCTELKNGFKTKHQRHTKVRPKLRSKFIVNFFGVLL